MAKKSVGKNILAVIAGIVVGSLVNIVLVNIGPSVVPLPEGADVSTMENLRDSMEMAFKPPHKGWNRGPRFAAYLH